MTTTTTAPAQAAAAPDKMTPAEIRQRFDELDSRIDALGEAIATMTAGLQHAATATATPGTFGEMMIDSILCNVDRTGKHNYMALGVPYKKYGVRIWEEVLPGLGLDPAMIPPGLYTIETPIPARVLLGETVNQKTGITGIGPRKVTGKA